MKRHLSVKKLTAAALLLALGMALPTLIHSIGAGPSMLPLHIPVLLGGLLLGAPCGAALGLLLPYLSSITSGMPPLFPTAVAMSLELCAYGVMTGILYRKLRWNVYPALIVSMLLGRAVSGLANAFLLGVSGGAYTMQAFLSASFIAGLPGIALQIAAVPLLIILLEKSRLFEHPAAEAGSL